MPFFFYHLTSNNVPSLIHTHPFCAHGHCRGEIHLPKLIVHRPGRDSLIDGACEMPTRQIRLLNNHVSQLVKVQVSLFV